MVAKDRRRCPDRWVAQGRCSQAGSGRKREACVSLGLTVDDILLLHHLLLMLLQEAAVHRKAPGVCRKVLLIHLKVTHQFVVDHFCTWVLVQEPPQNSAPLSRTWTLPWILSLPFPGFSHQPSQHASPPLGLLTFINKGFHGQGSVPHVEGVCGLGEDPTQPQGRLIIEMSEGSGGHLHHPYSGRQSLPRLSP